MKNLMVVILVLFSIHAKAQTENIENSTFFQNKFYTFDASSLMDCSKTAEENGVSLSVVESAIEYYEKNDKNASLEAIHLLADFNDPDKIKRVNIALTQCEGTNEFSICVLEKLWKNTEIAKRILALFYDTGTAILLPDGDEKIKFSLEQVQLIEKSIKKIPVSIRKKIILGRYSREFGQSHFLINGSLPLWMTTSKGNLGALGLVITGYNLITFNPKALDHAKTGKGYKDVGYRFLIDLRMQMIIHEIGHVVDAYFTEMPVGTIPTGDANLSTSPELSNKIDTFSTAIWPSHWFKAFFPNERYETNEHERFAEFFAQYILLPEGLKASSPEMYAWLRTNLFTGQEFEGYEKCKVARPMSLLGIFLAPRLVKD